MQDAVSNIKNHAGPQGFLPRHEFFTRKPMSFLTPLEARNPAVPDPEKSVGIIGLGLLGGGVARRFLEENLPVIGYDLEETQREGLTRIGGTVATSLKTLAQQAHLIFTCLPDHRALETVIEEMDPFLDGISAIIDLSTGSPEAMETLGKTLEQKGVAFLDGAVCGSSKALGNHEALILVAGPERTFSKNRRYLEMLGKSIFPVGAWGNGSRMKLVVNLALGLNRAVLAEALAFAESQGLDLDTALQILQQGPSASKAMEQKGQKMLSREYTPEARLSQHLKDVRLILESGKAENLTLPLSHLHEHLLEAAEKSGWGSFDNSAIFEIFRRDQSLDKEQAPPSGVHKEDI